MSYDFSKVELEALKPLVSTRAFNGIKSGADSIGSWTVARFAAVVAAASKRSDAIAEIMKIPNVSRDGATKIVDWIEAVNKAGSMDVVSISSVEEELVEQPVSQTLKYRRLKNVFTLEELTEILRPHMEKRAGRKLRGWAFKIEADVRDDEDMDEVVFNGVEVSVTSPTPVAGA
jgi:hypothetical protein